MLALRSHPLHSHVAGVAPACPIDTLLTYAVVNLAPPASWPTLLVSGLVRRLVSAKRAQAHTLCPVLHRPRARPKTTHTHTHIHTGHCLAAGTVRQPLPDHPIGFLTSEHTIDEAGVPPALVQIASTVNNFFPLVRTLKRPPLRFFFHSPPQQASQTYAPGRPTRATSDVATISTCSLNSTCAPMRARARARQPSDK